jgi:hypothetical protein
MRDDKSQQLILSEAKEIKTLINDQYKKSQLPTVDPVDATGKEEDRQKLATAIADKLGEILGDLGGNSGFDIPNIDGGKKGRRPRGGKIPGKIPNIPPGAGKLGAGAIAAAVVAAPLIDIATVAGGAYEANKFLDETDYGDRMAAGGKSDAGQTAQQAFRQNVSPRINLEKAGYDAEAARNALENGSPRDISKLGGRAELEKIIKDAELKGKTRSSSGKIEPAKITTKKSDPKDDLVELEEPNAVPKLRGTAADFYVNGLGQPPDQSDAETARLIRNNSKLIEAKKSQMTTGMAVEEVSKTNNELKNIADSQSSPTAIISNKTITNNAQTIVGAPSTPHSSSSSIQRWQDNRSTFA